MIDLGTKQSSMEVKPSNKNKVYYPSFSTEKAVDIKMGQPVTCEGVVIGIRKDKYGNSVSVEVRKLGVKGKISEKDFEKMSDKEQEDYIENQKEK